MASVWDSSNTLSGRYIALSQWMSVQWSGRILIKIKGEDSFLGLLSDVEWTIEINLHFIASLSYLVQNIIKIEI